MKLCCMSYGILALDILTTCAFFFFQRFIKFQIYLRVKAYNPDSLLSLPFRSCLVSFRELSFRYVFFLMGGSSIWNRFSSLSSRMVDAISTMRYGSVSLRGTPFISMRYPLKSVVKLPWLMTSDCLWRSLLFSALSSWTKQRYSSKTRCFFYRNHYISAYYQQLSSPQRRSPPPYLSVRSLAFLAVGLGRMETVLSVGLADSLGVMFVVLSGRWQSLNNSGSNCCSQGKGVGRAEGCMVANSISCCVHSTGNCLLSCKERSLMASVLIRAQYASRALLRMQQDIWDETASAAQLLGLCMGPIRLLIDSSIQKTQPNTTLDHPYFKPKTYRQGSVGFAYFEDESRIFSGFDTYNKGMRWIVTVASLILYCLAYFLIGIVKPPSQDHLQALQSDTSARLQELVQTKFFRIIRLNLNQQCPLAFTGRLCRSSSCRVCRCDEKEIPLIWSDLDKVASRGQGVEEWSRQRMGVEYQWLWHVEDEENDEGEYFDVVQNVESFTNYNGSAIWQLVYEENCFGGGSQYHTMCEEEQVLYRIVSGLHTSISTHLSALYTQPPLPGLQWARAQPKFTFNLSQYKSRVLDHPQRINNLLFLYEILARALKEVAGGLINNYTIQSDNISEDLRSTTILREVLMRVNSTTLMQQGEAVRFFTPANPKVKQFQRFIHNISRIMNCVDCQKCRVFGKMQTYGIGTALKILLGYKQPYKRNEIVALINTFNKVSISVGHFYSHMSPQTKLDHMQSAVDTVKMYYYLIGVAIVMVYVFSRIDIGRKVKKQFKHTFPNNPKFKVG